MAVAFVVVRLVVASVAIDPLVLTRFVIVPVVAPKFVAKRFVDVVFVPVALVQVIPETARGPVRIRFAIVAFVAPKFVEKLFVVVALVPTEFVKNVLVAKKFVAVVFWSDVVPVTVRLDIVAPPYNANVAVATEPRLVTERSVSVSMLGADAGQFVPFAKQTAWPVTKSDEPDAELKLNEPVDVPFVKFKRFAKEFVVVAFVPVELLNENPLMNERVPETYNPSQENCASPSVV